MEGNKAGAVYIFSRSNNTWSQPTYVKASNVEFDDEFGIAVSLSADGNTLAVGADWEESATTRITTGDSDDGDDNSAFAAGAVYLY